MPIGDGAGVSLGAARGSITIDLSDLNNVRVMTAKVGQEAEKNLGRMAAGAAKAQRSFAGLSGAVRQWAGVLGVSLGAAGAVQFARFAMAADAAATSYRRQSVAAVNLAGSQSKLNALLAAYAEATGGAIDRATSLSDVTRLQAVGFADSAEELTRFVTVARGISIAMGAQQDYVISQLQLAIANQSTLRLDQLGLGVAEVKKRIDELKDADKSLTTEMAYQNAILGLAEEKFGALIKSTVAQATGAEKAAAAAKDAQLAFGEMIGEDVAEATNMWANALSGLTDQIGKARAAAKGESLGTALLQWGGWQTQGQKDVGAANKEIDNLTNDLGRARDGLALLQRQAQEGVLNESAIQRQIGIVHQLEQALLAAGQARAQAGVSSRLMSGVGNYASIVGAGAGVTAPRFSGEQETLIRDRFSGLADIERDANNARLESTRQYEEQRTSTLRDYGKTIARDADDFGRARVRAEQEFAESIADVRQDAVRREAQQAIDFARATGQARSDADERIAEARADANERLAEMDEDYQKARVRAAGDHRDKLLDAASRLDAVAIFAEQRRFARESADAKEAHDEQRSDLKDQLADRIADEEKALAKSNRLRQEAYDRQLEDGRAADAERIADMQADFEDRKAQEDEDRALRLERMAEDHGDQLAEMDRQHALDLAQIATQEAEQRAQVQEEFEKAYAATGVQTAQREALYKKLTDSAIEDFDRWFEHMQKAFELAAASRLSMVSPRGYAEGGPVPYTGMALLHGGEFVLSRAMLAAGAGRGGVTFNGNISLSVAGSTDMGSGELYAVARRALVDALTEMAA